MLNPWFVTGFCQAQATFTYSRAEGSFNLYFSIRERGATLSLIEAIQRFFSGAGTIYYLRPKILAAREAGLNPQRRAAYYRVSRTQELKRISAHFDRYPLQGVKQEAFLVWRQMLSHKIENYRSADYHRLQDLSRQLSDINQKI